MTAMSAPGHSWTMRVGSDASNGQAARRPAAMLAASLLVGAVLASALPASGGGSLRVSGSTTLAPSAAGSYIVRALPGQLAELTAKIHSVGGHLDRSIGIIDAAVAGLPRGAADRLRADGRIAGVTADAPVRLLETYSSALPTGYAPGGDANSLYNIERNLGIRQGWSYGITGAGVDVALLDSGVAPVAGLSGSTKVLHGPDLTPESQNAATAHLDTYGHGTHMAGIIAGHDSGVAVSADNSTDFLGVAPNARIVSVKVADARGNTDVSQVIAGIDWVVQHAHDPGMNIRVLNLSFGTDSTQSYQLDPLAYAAEVAWRKGIVVVASAGNSGNASGRLTNPAMDPFILAVGAEQGHGGDDDWVATIPAFSSYGDGIRNPDLVVPGVHVQSLRVPGSYVDSQFAATGAISNRYFRGSGTSQAAAMLSGTAALVLSYRPGLTPDQVKYLFTSTAAPLPSADKRAQGHGRLNLSALASAVQNGVGPSIQPFVPSTGTGSLDAARGSHHQVLNDVPLSGEQDLMGQPFNAASVAAAELAGSSWAGGLWNGSAWAGNAWAGNAWAGSAWAGSSWAGSSWAGSSWATGSWTGSAWAGSSWAGSAWAGSSWAGSGWAGSGWADDSYS